MFSTNIFHRNVPRSKDTLPKLSFEGRGRGGGREGGREVELELRLGGKSRARGTRTETQRRGKEESLSPRGFATRSHVLSHVLSRLASLASQIEALACGL